MNGIIQKYHESKNIFDYTYYDNTNLGASGDSWFINNNTAVVRIPCKSSTTYTIKFFVSESATGNVFRVALCNSNNVPESGNPVPVTVIDRLSTGYNPYTLTTLADTKYILLQVGIGAYPNILSTTMIVEGSIAPSSYEPYGMIWNDIPYSVLENATDVITSLPVKVYIDGETDISLLLKGSTETSGTPSPQNPITIDGVGNKTANIFSSVWEQGIIDTSGNNIQSDTTIRTKDYIAVEYNKIYSISRNITGGYINVRFYDAQKQYIGGGSASTIELIAGSSVPNPMGVGAVFCCIKIIDSNIAYMRINDLSNDLLTQYMMVEGEYTAQTMPSFEPYGYKIPILKDSSPLTPIYVSEPLMKIGEYSDNVVSSGTATYAIKKYEITGQEDIRSVTQITGGYRFLIRNNWGLLNTSTLISSHFLLNASWSEINCIAISSNLTDMYFILPAEMNVTTINEFAQWLADQSTAGTPVTIWYVLATAQTETVTVPTISATDGEVNIDVDTTIKPSEINLTYHGWHEHQPKKKSANLFDGLFEQGTLSESSSSGSTYAQTKSGADTRRIRTTNLIRCNGECTISANFEKYQLYLLYYDQNGLYTSQHSGSWQSSAITINYPYVGIAVKKLNNSEITPNETDINLMVNSGSTPLPYAPYWE